MGEIDESYDIIDRWVGEYVAIFKRNITDPSATGWHVFFKCGTCARLMLDEVPEFPGYDGYDGYEVDSIGELFETQEELAKTVKFNRIVWDQQKNQFDGDVNKAMKQGMTKLINDGYPHPGGDGADRNGLPFANMGEEGLMVLVYFPTRNVTLFNLYVDPKFSTSIAVGGQMRRFDYIDPIIHSVVDPEGNQYMLPRIELKVHVVQVTEEEVKTLLGMADDSTSSDSDPYTSDIYDTESD